MAGIIRIRSREARTIVSIRWKEAEVMHQISSLFMGQIQNDPLPGQMISPLLGAVHEQTAIRVKCGKGHPRV